MKTILKEKKCQNCSEEGVFFEGQDEFRYIMVYLKKIIVPEVYKNTFHFLKADE